jgi:hypothetical protein
MELNADPTFDFISGPQETLGKDDMKLSSLAKLSPKELAQSIIEVYQRLGGVEWLLAEAQANPKSFFELLKKVMPTNIKVDGLDNLSVTLVNAFVPGGLPQTERLTQSLNNNDVIELEDRRIGIPLLTVDGSDPEDYKRLNYNEPDDEIATGGNLTETNPALPPEVPAPLPSGVVLKETFDTAEPRPLAQDKQATGGDSPTQTRRSTPSADAAAPTRGRRSSPMATAPAPFKFE